MTDKQRGFIYGLVAAYVLTGFFMAFAMKRHIPAMSGAGVVYYAVMWPGFIAAGGYGTPSPIIPKWTFNHGR